MSLVSIDKRWTRPDGVVMRELSCGHAQVERPGGKARAATHARCPVCPPSGTKRWNAKDAIGVCGAIVHPLAESKSRPCGRPARFLKRGEPRCGFHNARGAK